MDFEDIGLAEGSVLTNEVPGMIFRGAIVAAEGSPAYGFVSPTTEDDTPNPGQGFTGFFVTDPVVGDHGVPGLVEILFEDEIFDLSFQVADIDAGETFNAKIFGTDNTLLDEITFTVGTVDDFFTGDGLVTPIQFITPTAEVNQPYQYQVEAIDPDVEDNLSFSLLTAPVGMTIDLTTGLIQWSPTNDQVGKHDVTVKVADNDGLTDTQSFTVTVDTISPNRPPEIVSDPILNAIDGQLYSYDVEATDLDNDTLSYQFTSSLFGTTLAEDGLSTLVQIDPNTGVTTELFDFEVPEGFNPGRLTFHAPSRQFLIRFGKPGTGETKFGVLDPQSQQLNLYEFKGLPSLEYVVEGLEYRASTDQILITIGNTGSYVSDRIAEIDLQGNVLQVSENLGLGDRDQIAEDPSSDTLLGLDFNGTSPRIAEITDPFGTPNTTAVSTPPIDGRIYNVAISNAGRLFVSRIEGDVNELVEVIGSEFVRIGDFEIASNKQVIGLAFIHVPQGMTIDSSTGLIEWTPTADQIGNHDVTVTVSDSQGATDSQSFGVNVSALQEQITINAPGFTASTCASGGLLRQPIGIRFGPNGNLFVANSNSFLDSNVAEGNIVEIDRLGTQYIYSQGTLLQGPLDLEFNKNAIFGTIGELFVTLEDNSEAGFGTDLTVRIPANGSTPLQFSTLGEENFGIRIAPEGRFGNDLFYAAREGATGPYRLFRTNDLGNASVFTISSDTKEITGVLGLEFALGGQFGQDLYLSTYDDADQYDPNSSDGIYRVDATGAAIALLEGKRARFLAFSPDAQGPFGDYLYVTDGDNGTVYRVDSNGNYSLFASGFSNASGLAFGPDGNLCVADARASEIIRISPNPAHNFAPVITSTAITAAQAGILYSYDVEAQDPENDPLTFSLITAPTGMTIDPTTGLIQWTPDAGQGGLHTVEVQVQDGQGGQATQQFEITVQAVAVNQSPEITSTPIETVLIGSDYAYKVSATDADNDPLTYTLDVAPEGMSVSETGQITWANNTNTGFPVDVAVKVSDGLGGSAFQAWNINEVDIAPPQVTLKMTSNIIDLGQTLQVQVEVVSSANIIATDLSVEGFSVDLNSEGIATLQPQAIGFYELVATAEDEYGQIVTTQRQLLVGDANDTTYPLVDLQDGSECTDVTDLHPIIGTASDDSALNYWLFRKRQGTNAWTPFASGKDSVSNAELAVFDPTVLRNGIYDIQLFAYDSSGNVSKAFGCYIVDEGLKVGQVNFAQVDITIPALGIPLTVAREYDSRMLENGDFGPGWNLANKNVSASTSGPLGDDWGQKAQGGGAFDEFILLELQKHEVVIRFSDEDVLRFKMDVNPKSQFFVPLQFLTVDYVPVGNTQGTLEAYNYDRDVILQEPHLTLYDGTTIYNPQQFKLTRRDGSVYIIGPGGIESITDVYGHTVTYSDDGISHSSGASLNFTRGEGNRIELITTEFGTELEYHYDAEGYLEKVIQTNEGQGQRLSRILQNFQSNEIFGHVLFPDKVITHNHFTEIVGENAVKRLTDIKAPDGTVLGQFEYDGLGRMSALVDADGNRIVYGFDVPNHKQTITDRLGNETLYEYDSKGNVTKRTDALGFVSQWEYDAEGNETAVILPNGARTERTYNTAGDLLTESDPLGHVTAYTYDSAGRVLSITDPADNVTENEYDANGNLLKTTDPLGHVTSTFTYDADGNLTTATDPAGLVRSFGYDAIGNQTGTAYDWVNPDNVRDIRQVQVFTEYDSQGRVIATRDARGNLTRNVYDGFGNLVRITDPNGNVTTMTYNQLGKPIETVAPNGTVARMVYDDQGRAVVVTDPYVIGGDLPRGNRTTYDAEGQVIGTERFSDVEIEIEPDGTLSISHLASAGATIWTTANEYDALGRLTSSTDTNGAVTRHEYDTVGNRTAVVDTLGHRTGFEYDLAGRQTLVRDALGRETHFEYTPLGARTRTVFADGSATVTEYNALNNRTAVIDQEGKRTEYEYDDSGHLVAVVLPAVSDPENGNTPSQPRYEYEYGQTGSLLTIRDAKGRETHFTYDEHDQRLTRSLPLGQTEYFEYTTDGLVQRQLDFKGQATEFVYDSFRRVVEKRLYETAAAAPAVVIGFGYDALGRKTEIVEDRGNTSYAYDAEGDVTHIAFPEGTINYEYDPLNRRRIRTYTDYTDVRYSYDAMGRLVSTTLLERDGRPLIKPEVTTHTYTAFSKPDETTLPNGVVGRHTYNSLGRLTDLSQFSTSGDLVASYGYTLSVDGKRTDIAESIRQGGSAYQRNGELHL